MRHVKSNDALEGMYQVKRDIVYSQLTGQKLTLVYPWAADHAEDKPSLPLVVFVQGSGWTTPDPLFQLPQLCELARQGFVVASIVHRSIFDGFAFPAQVIDVKCAIRYLRAHARDFGIDPEHVAIWGTSSGGHIAQLVGVTAGIAEFESGEYPGERDDVCAVASCFGPCDLASWVEFNRGNPDCAEFIAHLLDGDEETRLASARRASSINYVTSGNDAIPPFFLSVGTDDQLVEMAQVTRMAEALEEAGADVEGVVVEGALHESTFWSQEVLELIFDFLARHLS